MKWLKYAGIIARINVANNALFLFFVNCFTKKKKKIIDNEIIMALKNFRVQFIEGEVWCRIPKRMS